MGNAIGYVRVSTAAQAEDGLGLEVQEEALRRWCAEQGVHMASLWRDEGISGTMELADRPGLGAAVAAIEDGTGDTLLVYRLDRLARDLVLQETVIDRVNQAGGQLVSVSEPDLNGQDFTRVMVRQILGAIAQYERMVILARMAAGRKAKASRGGYAFGAPGFGWRAVGRQLETDEEEQATMARILQLRADGWSLRQIGAKLEEEGRRTKRGGTSWDPSTIRRLLGRSVPAIPKETPTIRTVERDAA